MTKKNIDARPAPPGTRGYRWFTWVFGLAMLAAVTVGALHFSEERQIVRIAQAAQPWWLLAALLLQGATYVAEGSIWRVVLRAGGTGMSLSLAWRLSLAKLFIDQALPSGGISGATVVAQALQRQAAPRPLVIAAIVVDAVGYYGAYVLALALALVITALERHANTLVLVAAICFAIVSLTVAGGALAQAGRRTTMPRWLARIPVLRSGFALLGEADPVLARSPRLLGCGVLLQLGIMLLDAATVWTLIRSLGELASPAGVFASFMASTLLRTLSIVPGGLGVFEAASVTTLQLAGVSLPVALAATLLFRGLSFWLPMIPGVLFAHAQDKPV